MKPVSPIQGPELHDRYYERVRAFVRTVVKDPWVVEDVVQEAFLRALKNLGSLKDPSRARPWLFRIAHNACLDHFRSQKALAGRTGPLDDAIPAPAPTQEKRLAREQMSACVQRQAEKLPDNLRVVLWLSDVGGFSGREIAGILGIRVGNVKVRLHRARARMKEILQENCRFEKDERNVLVCEPLDPADAIGDLRPRADG